MSNEHEYTEIFLAEALENHTELNRLLTILEKKPSDTKSIQAIFRITHTLKGNALGLGYDKIAELAHTLEDLFGLIREEKMEIDESLLKAVYKGVDCLGGLIDAVKSGADVRYKGIKTKIEVMIRNAQDQPGMESSTPSPAKFADAPETEDESYLDEPISEDSISFSDLVQIPVRKLDNLLNLVSELVIEKDRFMVTQRNLSSELARLNRITSDLQYSVMDVRLVQVGFVFKKFHRIVRDAAALERKEVILTLAGTETEIDRNILQVISDSLIHLIRNAVGHGIELPEERVLAGKNQAGTIVLKAETESDTVVISIADDGAGMDVEKIRTKAIDRGLISRDAAIALPDDEVMMFIFEPGFSTADTVNGISGRGVGMDVVKRALDSIGGNIQISTRRREGTTFRLTLPASMAVKSTLLFELGAEQYAIPLSYTEAVISVYAREIVRAGNSLVGMYLGKPIPVLFLRDLFDSVSGVFTEDGNILHRSFRAAHPEQKLDIVVVSHNGRRTGLVVDKLLQQKEIIEKQLARPADRVSFVGGATILGNGRVCLVLNVAMIVSWMATAGARNISSKV